MERTHVCPLCGASNLPTMTRYPRYVCGACKARVRSADGRPLLFTNEGMWGGFVARYADDRSAYEGLGRCFIDGVACYASDGRFGGIVVQVALPDADDPGA